MHTDTRYYSLALVDPGKSAQSDNHLMLTFLQMYRMKRLSGTIPTAINSRMSISLLSDPADL